MLDALAQRYHQRPSAFLGIKDDWLAYQLDIAVFAVAMKSEESAAVNTVDSARVLLVKESPEEIWERLCKTGKTFPE